MRIWTGFGMGQIGYDLNLRAQSYATLVTLRSVGNTFKASDGSEELEILLTGAECRVFQNIIHWLNGEPLQSVDTAYYDYNSHISEWCTLFVLATKFGFFDLAEEALDQYQACRTPHWQGSWLPLPAEIEYLWHNSPFSVPMKQFITRHIMSQLLTQRCQTNLGDIANLMSCNVELILDVLRAVRSHLSEDVGATEFCGIDECAYHLHLWTQSDDDEGERPPSDCGFSDHTEPILYMSPPNITLDEEDAFAAAHSSEALSEERHIRKESERISGLSLSVLEWNAHVSPYFP